MAFWRKVSSSVLGGVVAGLGCAASRKTAVWCQEERAFVLEVLAPVLPEDLDKAASAAPTSASKAWGIKWDDTWDGRGSAAAAAETNGTPSTYADVEKPRGPRPVRQLLLVRHGQYMNESNKDARDAEKVLTPLGVEQARSTGRFLRDALENRVGSQIFVANRFNRVYVSDLTRAKQTAKYLLETFTGSDSASPGTTGEIDSLLQAPDALLNEKFPCDCEPPFSKKAKNRDMQRSEEAFRKYFYRPNDNDATTMDLIVGHGNIIRYFVCRALQFPPEAWLRMSIPHCSVTNFVVRADGTVKIVAYGSFSHLAPQLQTVTNL